jgi:hypothetical protein
MQKEKEMRIVVFFDKLTPSDKSKLFLSKLLLLISFFSFSNLFSQFYIIGDSQSFQLEKVSNAIIYPGLAKSGIGIKELISMVNNVKQNQNARAIFITIGVNDSYYDFGIKDLLVLLEDKFPNAIFFVIRGSYGWGNVGLTKALIDRYFYYYKTWNSFGIYSLEQDIGSGDPHSTKIEYYKIGKKINYIISKLKMMKTK